MRSRSGRTGRSGSRTRGWPSRAWRCVAWPGRRTAGGCTRWGTEDNTRPGAQALQVTRQDRRGLVTLPDLTTDPDGTFGLVDRPRTTGETVYTLRFGGTDSL